MKSLIIALSFLSLPAFANTETFTVKGMHCGECATSVEATVCKLPGITACKVEVTDEKHKIGTVTVTSEKPMDKKAIQTALDGAGKYTLTTAKPTTKTK